MKKGFTTPFSSFFPGLFFYFFAFFDSLTPESFEKYESMLSEVTAAAAECGEVYRSPFEDIALYDYSEELREKVLCTCRVFREEIARLSHYADMCFDTFRHLSLIPI